MTLLTLSFESKEDSLSARRFTAREAISGLFEVSVWARSPNEDIDLDAIVGKRAALRIEGLPGRARVWSGVCSVMEQEEAEEAGLSSYYLRIVPALWLLSQRRNHRIFQHLSAPEIAERLLDEWGIPATWSVHRPQHPVLEYRVQYGESDFAFLSRVLEDAGISYFFSDHEGKESGLVLSDAPHRAEERPGGAISYIEQPSKGTEKDLVTRVRVRHEVRPNKVTLRSHDFRRKADVRLAGEAVVAGDAWLEQVHYQPGAFVVEGHKGGETPVGDDKGVARSDERVAKALAERRLAAERMPGHRVAFHTNVLDLAPGTIFALSGHARSDLGPGSKLLVTELAIDGTLDGDWTIAGETVFAGDPYAPSRKTPKPTVQGVETAVVVGRRGQEIDTDELGRVRVQFPWDREGVFDDGSSCWMRVSQGWAGGGFGLMTIPRVGQEVLVGFMGGDPDQPMIVGRVFNSTAPVPYKLPENKTRSTWKSASSPGADGFNEIMFEDAKGAELVYVQAERNLDKLVKVDESVTIGHNRDKRVGVDESIDIGVNRTARVGSVDSAWVGARHAVTMGQSEGAAIPPTGTEMVDRRITLTTGEATITLEGPNITLDAVAGILLKAGADIAVGAGAHVTVNAGATMTLKSGATLVVQAEDGDVVIQGGPIVRINPEDKRVRHGEALPVEAPPEVDFDEEVEEAEDHAWFNPETPDWLRARMRSGDWQFARRHGEKFKGFESFHLGAVMAAMGLPEGVALRQAGMRRREREEAIPAEHGDPGNGLWGGKEPYGLDPGERAMMQKGMAFYVKDYK